MLLPGKRGAAIPKIASQNSKMENRLCLPAGSCPDGKTHSSLNPVSPDAPSSRSEHKIAFIRAWERPRTGFYWLPHRPGYACSVSE